MTKNPIVITSLEEDFRKIGLIKESAEVPATEETEIDTDIDTDDADLDEARKSLAQRRAKKRVAGGRKMVRPQELASQAELAKRRRMYKSKKRKIARQSAKRSRTGRGKKLARLAAALSQRESFDAAEALKSFANAAIIAERLQTVFTEWVKTDLCESADDESSFLKLAGSLGEIAEAFAEIATAIHEGEDLDADELAEAFAEGMETVLDAVDLYEKNDEDMEDEDEDMEDEEEESDDEGND